MVLRWARRVKYAGRDQPDRVGGVATPITAQGAPFCAHGQAPELVLDVAALKAQVGDAMKAGPSAEPHERLRQDYATTREAADSGGQRWTEDDDRYILANLAMPAREFTLAVGRTSFAVYQRRVTLRRRRVP